VDNIAYLLFLDVVRWSSLGKSTDPDGAARGAAPVRQYPMCDENKILPHKILGIDLS